MEPVKISAQHNPQTSYAPDLRRNSFRSFQPNPNSFPCVVNLELRNGSLVQFYADAR